MVVLLQVVVVQLHSVPVWWWCSCTWTRVVSIVRLVLLLVQVVVLVVLLLQVVVVLQASRW